MVQDQNYIKIWSLKNICFRLLSLAYGFIKIWQYFKSYCLNDRGGKEAFYTQEGPIFSINPTHHQF
jgi:hypothetical protein